jgi:hypothetical protein
LHEVAYLTRISDINVIPIIQILLKNGADKTLRYRDELILTEEEALSTAQKISR